MAVANGSIAEQVKEVHECAMGCLRASSVRHLADRLRPWLANGKMLRARLVLRLGAVTGVPVEDSLRAATAVELIHAASLLHDDVIDEGHLRRGRPAMWVEEGIKSAILLGDLLVCHAMGLAQRCRDASIAGVLVESAQEMCDAETQQELLLKGNVADWDTCVSVARRKTGSLFAFAAYAGAGPVAPLRVALRQAGYAIGTAYQLADDVFDAQGDPVRSDKTLGRDAANAKPTAVSAAAAAGIDARRYVWNLCDAARAPLAPWPDAQSGWDAYMMQDLKPAVDGFFVSAGADARV